MIADSDEEISYTGVEGVKAVMVEDEAIGLMWWTAEGDEAGEEADEVEKNPFRRWADEEVEVDREGLGHWQAYQCLLDVGRRHAPAGGRHGHNAA